MEIELSKDKLHIETCEEDEFYIFDLLQQHRDDIDLNFGASWRGFACEGRNLTITYKPKIRRIDDPTNSKQTEKQ